jgi:predicted dehydrogenase
LGGGVVRTLCHPLDYVRWLAGDFSALSAAIAPLPELALTVDAVADILIRFRSGASGSIHLDYVQRPAEHQFTAIGTQGSLRWNNADGELLVWRGR